MDDDKIGYIGCIGCLWFFGIISGDMAIILVLLAIILL